MANSFTMKLFQNGNWCYKEIISIWQMNIQRNFIEYGKWFYIEIILNANWFTKKLFQNSNWCYKEVISMW